MKPFRIRVPASSANIGPGFDSVGLALNLYLTLDVSLSAEWEVIQHSRHLPVQADDEDHYIFQIARNIALRWNRELPVCRMAVQSEIPLARGFGSSASAIVAGIELANQLCSLSLSREQKLELGSEIEGHPDNIAPAVMGGFVISTANDYSIEWIQLPAPDVEVIVYIPGYDLKTEAARKVLPESYSRELAASASAVSNVLIAALSSGNYELAGKMMERDLFHEPYRAQLIPNYDDIRYESKKYGAYGTVISGAGPTMISFAPKGKGQSIITHFINLLSDYEVTLLQLDHGGATVDASSKHER
ncbi:homoserine kinase [Lentibacillus halodurans]|uniref:Homoserine kinase n=1 Tax=Lentibacillus halodurans TaxID=237679 RepID=A0A1I0Y352_9BACI|nr:homoserine kinase [Lentibacillus halodurans]SFB07040.1 homoserine kinase [Lentibacillus halodurans]